MNAQTTEEHAAMELVPQEPQPAPAALALPADNSPMGAMMAALQRGVSPSEVREMLALQREWEGDQARKAFNVAFAAFKAESPSIKKGRKVTDGPLRGKSYAELHDWIDAVNPVLSKHGLSTKWVITRDEPQWIEVLCELRHVGGHIEVAKLGGPPDVGGAKNAIQARASTVSYLERYTLKAVLGLSEGGDDDDGAGGQGQTGKKAQAAEPEEAWAEAGRLASLQGSKSLNAWWGKLTEVQRTAMTPSFKGLREAARLADAKTDNKGGN